MAINKKRAAIFTISSILLVGVLISQVAMVTQTTYRQKSFIVLSRINSMNDFIGSVEEDIPRSMLISGYRALISMQKHLADNGTFVDVSEVFEELFLNGTIDGVNQSLMANASINEWAVRINDEAAYLNINVNLTPRNVYLYHKDPWSITIQFNTTLHITDFNSLASWYFNETYEKEISILTFEDPLYTIKSSDKVTNTILRANDTDFVDDATNDTTVLYNHLNNSYYIASTDGPSFLMRFEGNLSNSNYGIESLVNREDFSKQSIPTYDKSVVDWQYFNDSYDESSDYCNYDDDGMPSWFRIGPGKVNDYELTGLGSVC
ncbi:hypothetical protein GOV08_02690 [Candidatus Woesearchaeota archaeon]|nr:hypothetical protein [Candidatus Woesearchaeota archaeon]